MSHEDIEMSISVVTLLAVLFLLVVQLNVVKVE